MAARPASAGAPRSGERSPAPPRRSGRPSPSRAGSTGPATLFVAFFTIPFLLFNVAPVLFGIYVALHRVGHRRRARPGSGSPTYREALADDWVAIAFVNVSPLRADHRARRHAARASLFALFVHQRWPLATLARTLFFTPNVVSATVIGLVWVWLLDTQFGLLNHYLGLLGIGTGPLADLGRLVAGRRLDRLDLVGPRPRLRALPGGAAGRAARPLRGGRDRRRRPAAPVLARDPAASAARDQHGRDPAADRDLAHLQPGLRHDQRRPGRRLVSRSSTISTRPRSCSTGWATPRPSRCCCSR